MSHASHLAKRCVDSDEAEPSGKARIQEASTSAIGKAQSEVERMASQDAIRITLKPNMEMVPKLRCANGRQFREYHGV